MKKLIIPLMFFCGFSPVFSQNYDLVILTNGDSIACHIDSITDTRIYLEMFSNNKKVHTYMSKENIIDYKDDVINKKVFYINYSDSRVRSKVKVTGNQHKNMYLFSPTVFPLEREEAYFTTFYGLIYDIQYGIDDRLTIRFGADLIFFPFYILPTYSIPINEKSNVSIGNLLLVAVDEFACNLTYGMYTYGNCESSITVGAGLFATNTSETAPNNISPAITLSGQYKLSDNVFLISENYGFSYNVDRHAGNYILETEEEYYRKDYVFFGMTGLKVIRKKQPLGSWQFSLLYVLNMQGEAPEKYHTSGWSVDGENEVEFVPVPLISYSRKFGKKYKK